MQACDATLSQTFRWGSCHGLQKHQGGGGIPGVICFLIIDGVCVGSENSFSRHAPRERDKGRCACAQVIVITVLPSVTCGTTLYQQSRHQVRLNSESLYEERNEPSVKGKGVVARLSPPPSHRPPLSPRCAPLCMFQNTITSHLGPVIDRYR